MAIIIPSNKIYKIDNQKVVDNKMSRVETTLKQYTEEFEVNGIFTNQSFETNDKYTMVGIDTVYSEFVDNGRLSQRYPNMYGDNYYYSMAGVLPYYADFVIEVDASNLETYYEIEKLKLTTTPFCDKKTVAVSGSIYEDRTFDFSTNEFTPTFKVSKLTRADFGEDYLITNEVPLYSKVDDYEIVEGAVLSGADGAYASLQNQQSFTLEKIDSKYKISLKLLIGTLVLKVKKVVQKVYQGNTTSFTDGILECYLPQSIIFELRSDKYTLLSSEINISVENDDNGIVYSTDSNGLMQATYKSSFENNLKRVLNNYQNGKEIATVLCSVSEYHDEKGNLVIDPKTKDKMLFSLYDKVIPNRMNARGLDEPIARDSDGASKIFTVLGSNVYYDGAVWQELTLQESGVLELVKISTPNIYISGDYLLITDTSGVATNYDVYVNNRFFTNIKSTSLDLSKVEFSQGTNTIYIVAKAMFHYDSDASSTVTYMVKLVAPSISLNGAILTIVDPSYIADNFYIYVNGIYQQTINRTVFDVRQLKLTDATNRITVKSGASGYRSSDESNVVYYSISALPAPIISIDGSMLTIVDESNTATAFIIYANDTYVATISEKEYDLSRIALENGTYSIAVKASAPTLATSDFSNEVSYIVYRESSWVEENGKTVYYLKMNDLKLGDNYIRGEDFVLTIVDILESEQYGNRVYTPIYIRSSSNIAEIQFTSSIPLGSQSLGDIEYEGNRAYVTYNSEELAYGTYEIIEELERQSTCRFIPMEPYNELTLWIKYLSGDNNSYIPNDSADKVNLIISVG